jgi:hypothetical protein
VNVDEVGYDEDTIQEETELYTQLYDGDANYGHAQEVTDWAKAGISFFGHHSAGGAYSAGMFAALGGELWEVRASDDDDRPLIPVNSNGQVDEDALREARGYYGAVAMVKAEFGIPDKANPATPWEWAKQEEQRAADLVEQVRLTKLIQKQKK